MPPAESMCAVLVPLTLSIAVRMSTPSFRSCLMRTTCSGSSASMCTAPRSTSTDRCLVCSPSRGVPVKSAVPPERVIVI